MAKVNSYPIFEPNQVLNHSHLNGLRDYLEEQSRLTRSKLIGIGVVCGFDISVDNNSHITLSKGCGITSEGYLACLEETTFTHYKAYTDPSAYEPFSGLSSGISVLLTGTESDATALPTGNFLNDKVVVAFVECEDNKVDACLAQNCDEQGTWRDFNLRFLLITKVDAGTLPTVAASLYKKYQLDPVAIERISCLTGKIEDLSDFDAIASRYANAMSAVIQNVNDAIDKAYETFEPVLGKSITVAEKNSATLKINDLGAFIASVIANPGDMPQMVQYYYDFVKDLISAYNTFIETAFDLMAECCPDDALFPKHLLLGDATSSLTCKPSVFRHYFEQAPIYNGNMERLKEVVRLFKKILLMVENSRLLDDLSSDSSSNGIEIKITPSKGPASPLSERAIPYYYHVSNPPESLYEYWNDDQYRKCKADLNLSYHSSDYSSKAFINNPLCYNLDAYPFFRIEGQIGKNATNAYGDIDKIRRSSNLPFELLMLFDGDTPSDSSGTSYGYEDLQTIYAIWRNKLLLCLNNMIKLTDQLEKDLLSRKSLSKDVLKTGDEVFSYLSLAMLKRANAGMAVQGRDASTKKPDDAGLKKMATAFSRMEMDANFANILMENTRISDRFFSLEEKIKAAPVADAGHISSDEQFVRDTLRTLNRSLHALIKSLVPDLQDFEFDQFYKNYSKCLSLNINIMKYLADAHIRAEVRRNNAAILKIFCWVHHILSAIAICPYIDIRVLLDNLAQRKIGSSEEQNLYEFMKKNPGMEHHAGVYKGGTFILVYKSGEEKIVADFSLPYMACCNKAERSAVVKPLTPLVLPVCAVLGQSRQISRELSLQLLNNVYDPSVFEPVLRSEPTFGKAEFKDEVYEPEPAKTKKVLLYTMDVEKIKEVLALDNTKSVIVDEFEYEIENVAKNTMVGKSTITVFIFTQARATAKKTTTVSGKATFTPGVAGAAGSFPLRNATISDSNSHTATTDAQGQYSLEVFTGANKMTASHKSFVSKELSIDAIADKVNGLNFDLQISKASEVKVRKFGELHGAMEITYGSKKASEVEEAYDGRMKQVRKKLEELKDKLDPYTETPIYAVVDTVELFMGDEKINILKMNNEYVSTRDELFERIKQSSGEEKVLQIEAYKTMTMSYINRLALEQPKKLSGTTKKAFGETARQMKLVPEMNMEDEIAEWSAQVDKILPDSIIHNVRKGMFR